MKRTLPENWQTKLINTILRGQFLLSPESAMGLRAQVQALLNRDTLYSTHFPALDTIVVQSYTADGNRIPHPASRTPHPESRNSDSRDSQPEEKKVIVLPVKGTMLKYGTMCSYGMDEIADATRYYAAQKDVAGIVLDIDTGGGSVNSVPPLLEAIASTRSQGKAIVAHCDAACSAGYWTASATDRIFANNTISSVFGSVGVMTSYLDMVPYYEKEGAKYHEVYSSHSADKNSTFQKFLKGEYQTFIEVELDPIAIQFQEAVKSGRSGKINTEAKGVLTGATFNADKSLELGLIDQIGGLSQAINYVHAQAWANT